MLGDLQNEVGKGAFQELDQCAAAAPYTRASLQCNSIEDIPSRIEAAFRAAMSHGYGSSYVDVPSNVFMSTIQSSDISSKALLNSVSSHQATPQVAMKHPMVIKIIRLVASSTRYVCDSLFHHTKICHSNNIHLPSIVQATISIGSWISHG